LESRELAMIVRFAALLFVLSACVPGAFGGLFA
jgi:hypothetical protein